MRPSFNFALTLLFAAILFSCQKEVSYEAGQASRGSLQNDAGDCLPKLLGGVYKAGQALNDSNYLDVTVNVTTAGTYNIHTDTTNGYYFHASGVFAATGANTVRLKGTGTPSAAGSDDFFVFYDTSICQVTVPVLASGGGSGGSALFTLSGAGSTCMNYALGSGTYTQGTALNSTNTVSVQVNVTTPGTWTLSTNSVTGFSFAGSGTFTATGVQTITLQGTGTPNASGTQTFTVTAGSASCTFPVSVGGSGTPVCATPQGTYTAGTALAATNKISVQHTYATAGNFTVSTNTVNGYSFGPYTAAGTAGSPVTFTVNGTGTPTAAGTNTFTLNFGDGNTCTFTVTVQAGSSTPPSGDHYFVTPNSWWSYETPLGSPDSLKRMIVGSGQIAGVTYNVLQEQNAGGQIDDSIYVRKSGNNYWEINYVDYYSSFYFDTGIVDSLNFLKEGLTTGQTWSSPVYSGTDGGQPKKLRYDYTCTNASATVTVNGKTFTNVYQVTTLVKVSTDGGSTYTTDMTYINYYAQGIGWIYQKIDDGTNQIDFPIRNYHVN